MTIPHEWCAETEKRLDQLSGRFDAQTTNMECIHKDLARHAEVIANHESCLQRMEREEPRVQGEIKRLAVDITGARVGWGNVEKRVAAINRRLDTELARLTERLDERFDALDHTDAIANQDLCLQRIERSEAETSGMIAQFKERFDHAADGRREMMKAITRTNDRVDELGRRIETHIREFHIPEVKYFELVDTAGRHRNRLTALEHHSGMRWAVSDAVNAMSRKLGTLACWIADG